MPDRPWIRSTDEVSTGDPVTDQAIELAHDVLDLARAGDVTVLDWVDRGVPVDLTDPDGNTLLMLAAYHGHATVVAELADRGADVDRANDRGQSPLAGAVFKGEPEVIRTLVAAGADPDAGEPSARAATTFFERPDLADLLGSAGPTAGDPAAGPTTGHGGA